MYPGDVISEKLGVRGVRAEIVDLATRDARDVFVHQNKCKTFLLNDGLSDHKWDEFAKQLPQSVLIGVHGSTVKIGHTGVNPVFHEIHVVME